MPSRQHLVVYALCLTADLATPHVVAEDPPPGSIFPDYSIGKFKTYDASDNKLLVPAEKKNSDREDSNLSPEAQATTASIFFVNNLGNPKRIMFEGVSLFSEKEIRHALECDLKYQAAARPTAETKDLLEMLERRLRDGYRHCGCPDASARELRRKTSGNHCSGARRSALPPRSD
jgi:hypothetical protein